ncbi:MAG: energy transducer TonB [Chitinophagaceae bacterium]|nr:energy transducer TonB [Chitinophagaceae bacterium]
MRADIVMQSDLLDILFEHRNKEYGAYTLRKEYNHRLMLALAAMFSIVILFFSWFFFNNNRNRDNGQIVLSDQDSITIKVIDIPKDPLPPPPPPPQDVKPQPPVATIKSTTLVIVPNDMATDPPPPVDQLDKDDALISDKTVDGAKPDGNMPVSASSGNGTGPVQPQPVPEPEPEKIVEFAERMPEFPGGTQALIRFLSKNLRVPEEKIEPGQLVKVPVKFVVDKEGKLTDVQFPGAPDEAFKTEIRRVMNKMPKWIPGSQNGKPVAVYFNIPIVFQVTDQ